jgi:uncharacterized coiled-coil DUF342 family protein
MSNPTKLVINCATGTREEIPLTQGEIDERLAMSLQAEEDEAAALEAAEALEELKTSARSKLVAGEPLTQEEASTLII